ncbi:hypothetical protein IT411_00975 [Candidatus Peregrinibacteria bacterium]|nr:hypothetical protein [Candidatus Peregrinibacteria bacterium]
MAPENGPKIRFLEGNAPAPEKTPGNPEAPKEPGQTISAEFKSEGSKAILAKEFNDLMTKNAGAFTPEFRKSYYDANGQPKMDKILAFYGVDESFSDLLSKDGTVRPDIIEGTYTPKLELPSLSSGIIPERPGNAPTGSEFLAAMNQLGNMNSKENQYKMEQYVMAEIARGNIPSFCRPENMKPVTMEKNGVKVQFLAAQDYLAVGSDTDFVRIPMTPILAQTLSEKYGWGMPTRNMTREIYRSADLQITGPTLALVHSEADQMEMQKNGFIKKHNDNINTILGEEGLNALRQNKALVAGHKKDVIISRHAIDHPGSLDFDGLYLDGKNPTQHNAAHESTYRDYSHGFRPIYGNVTIADKDGGTITMPYYEALKDPQIAAVLNGAEGAIDAKRAYQDNRYSDSAPEAVS